MLRTVASPYRTVFPIILLAMIFVISCGPLLAAAEHGGLDRSGDLLDLLFRFINFGLLVLILFWVLKKVKIKTLLSARSKEIEHRLEELKKSREEYENKCREMEKKLKEFERKKEEIIAEFKSEGLAEKERIIASARERARQVVEQAGAAIQQEMRAARDNLKMEIMAIAARKAGDIISGTLTEKDQDRLVNDFIEKMRKVH